MADQNKNEVEKICGNCDNYEDGFCYSEGRPKSETDECDFMDSFISIEQQENKSWQKHMTSKLKHL